MTKHEAKTKLFAAVISDLYLACQDGDRAAADASLRELAGMLSVDVEELTPALRPWVHLPPSEADIRRMIEENRQMAHDAETADLVF